MVAESYRAILRAPHARALVLAGFVARVPVGAVSLALVLYVRDELGTFAAAGGVVAAYALAGAVLAPLQGRLVDRLGQTRVLVPFAAVNAAALVALVAAGAGGAHAAVIVACAALAGATIPPISACMRVLWPGLVDRPERLQTAYALEAVSVELFFIAGPLLTAAAVALASPGAALLASAALSLLGSVAFAMAAPSRAWRGVARAAGLAGPLGAPGIRTLVVSLVPVGLAFGAIEVSVAAFADARDAGAAAGVALAALGLGSMSGGLWYGVRQWRTPPWRRYLELTFLFAACLAPLALAGSIPAIVALLFVAGLPLAPTVSVGYLLIDELAPPGTATEAYAWLIVANVAGSAAGAALAGTLVEHAGVRWALLGACASVALGGAVAFVRRRTLAPA